MLRAITTTVKKKRVHRNQLHHPSLRVPLSIIHLQQFDSCPSTPFCRVLLPLPLRDGQYCKATWPQDLLATPNATFGEVTTASVHQGMASSLPLPRNCNFDAQCSANATVLGMRKQAGLVTINSRLGAGPCLTVNFTGAQLFGAAKHNPWSMASVPRELDMQFRFCATEFHWTPS